MITRPVVLREPLGKIPTGKWWGGRGGGRDTMNYEESPIVQL